MFEHSLAKVLEDPTDNNLPHYDEELIKKNTSLSPHGRNVIHPLLVRNNGATYSERTAGGKIIKRVINPNEVSLRSSQGGENLLPEKLQDLFTLRLADSNALQKRGPTGVHRPVCQALGCRACPRTLRGRGDLHSCRRRHVNSMI